MSERKRIKFTSSLELANHLHETEVYARSCRSNNALKDFFERLRQHYLGIYFPQCEKIIPGSLDVNTETAVHLATRHYFRGQARLDVINLLLEKYEDVNYTSQVDGLSHFYAACQIGNFEMVRKFVENGVDVNLPYEDYTRTPLNTTVYFKDDEDEAGRLSILELLLQKGANPEALSEDGKTALNLIYYTFMESHKSAARNAKLEMVKLLLQYNVDVNKADLSGSSPIFSLFHDFTTRDASQVELLDILLRHGVDLQAVNSSGHTILHWILRPTLLDHCTIDNYEKLLNDENCVEVVTLLLKYGVYINVKDIMDHTPLQIAVSNLNSDVVKLLLDHGADLSGIAMKGGYFDHDFLPTLEMTQNLLDTIQLLESKGYNMDMKNKLQVLKFLVGSNQFPWNFKTIHILDYSSELKVRRFISKNFKNIDDSIYSFIEFRKGINKYLKTVTLGDLYEKKKILDFSNRNDSFNANEYDLQNSDRIEEEIKKELEGIAKIMITKNMSVLDLCKTSPDKICKIIANSEYVSKLNLINLKNDFPYLAEFIKGQINRCLITIYSKNMINEIYSIMKETKIYV